MIINKKYVRKLDAYFGGLIPHTDFKCVVNFSHITQTLLDISGFKNLKDGDTLLPPAIGKTSRINSEGTYVIHRDRPKELRLVGRREWTREEWAGHGQTNTITETVDIYRNCYMRTFITPQAVELTVVEQNGSRFIVSPTLTWKSTQIDEILHTVNLMLELFGEVEIRHANLASFLPPQTQRVNWTLLPPGNTEAGVSAHVRSLVGRTAPTFRGPIMERLTFLASRNPPEIFLGHGGFHAYVAYVFSSTGMTILESVLPMNATYIFSGNWQAVSHLTKSQILAGSHNHARVIHDKNWQANLTQYTG